MKKIIIDTTEGEDKISFSIKKMKGKDVIDMTHSMLTMINKLGYDYVDLEKAKFKKLKNTLILSEKEEDGDLVKVVEFETEASREEILFLTRIVAMGLQQMVEEHGSNN